MVAIKKQVLNLPSRDDKHIYNEVNIVSEINHKNIVRCLGYCHEIKVALVCLDDEYIGDKQPTYCFVEEYTCEMGAVYVTWIRMGSGVSVSDTYRIRIRLGYVLDMLSAVSQKDGYVLAQIRVFDTYGTCI